MELSLKTIYFMNSFLNFLVFNYSLHSLLFGISLRCIFHVLLVREETESEGVEVICPRLGGETGSPAVLLLPPLAFRMVWKWETKFKCT